MAPRKEFCIKPETKLSEIPDIANAKALEYVNYHNNKIKQDDFTSAAMAKDISPTPEDRGLTWTAGGMSDIGMGEELAVGEAPPAPGSERFEELKDYYELALPKKDIEVSDILKDYTYMYKLGQAADYAGSDPSISMSGPYEFQNRFRKEAQGLVYKEQDPLLREFDNITTFSKNIISLQEELKPILPPGRTVNDIKISELQSFADAALAHSPSINPVETESFIESFVTNQKCEDAYDIGQNAKKAVARFLDVIRSEQSALTYLDTSVTALEPLIGAAAGDLDAPVRARLEREAAQKALSEELVEQAIAESHLYSEQCFVLSQIVNLVEYRKGEPALIPELAYDPASKNQNSPLLIQGEPFSFINKMVQYPSTTPLFNLTTAQLSSLVPTIRLYKIETDPKTGKDIGMTEIKFDTNPSVKSYINEEDKPTSALELFTSLDKRGFGVGLKDFEFTFHGSDPFAVKKAIEGKLTIFATSFGDLITQRDGYKYADLALKTGKTPEELRNKLSMIDQENLDKLNFRLKAVVGWAVPHTKVGDFEFNEIDAVQDSFVTLNLTPTIHEFNFDEMGGVTFVINYLAYIEDYFNDSIFNIFSNPEIEKVRQARKIFFEFLETQNCEEESLKAIREADTILIRKEKEDSFKQIIGDLKNQNKIFSYNLTYDQIAEFLYRGYIKAGAPSPEIQDDVNIETLEAAFKLYESETEEASRERVINLTRQSRDSNRVNFFFVSDLMEVIFKNLDDTFKTYTEGGVEKLNYIEMLMAGEIENDITVAQLNVDQNKYKNEYLTSDAIKEYEKKLFKAKEQFKKFRLVLGPIEIRDPFDNKKITYCSIGDLPISLNYFTEFLTSKMISSQETFYPVTNFIKDFISDVIKNFLNNDGCFAFDNRQKIKINSSVITGNNRKKNTLFGDDISYFNSRELFGKGNVLDLFNDKINDELPIILTSGPTRSPLYLPPIESEVNYYTFYSGRTYPIDKMNGDADEDSKNGIYHYVLGKDRGIVKNISLERTDLKGLKEMRFEKEGYDGLTQLREVYNANIDCLLNVQAYPGMYIYVDPSGFSPEATFNYSQFGIGGYYMIITSKHSIGAGKADTSIVAKWVADTSGRIESQEEDPDPEKDGNSESRKCVAKYRETAKTKSTR